MRAEGEHFAIPACRPRKVWEETGYDASKLATEEDVLALYLNSHQTTMFIVPGVDEDFSFEPKVRTLMSVQIKSVTLSKFLVP